MRIRRNQVAKVSGHFKNSGILFYPLGFLRPGNAVNIIEIFSLNSFRTKDSKSILKAVGMMVLYLFLGGMIAFYIAVFSFLFAVMDIIAFKSIAAFGSSPTNGSSRTSSFG